jgi:hypothetical protein
MCKHIICQKCVKWDKTPTGLVALCPKCEACPFCLDTPVDPTKVDTCAHHVFCFKCITNWAENTSTTCPVCNVPFTQLDASWSGLRRVYMDERIQPNNAELDPVIDGVTPPFTPEDEDELTALKLLVFNDPSANLKLLLEWKQKKMDGAPDALSRALWDEWIREQCPNINMDGVEESDEMDDVPLSLRLSALNEMREQAEEQE